MLYYNTGFDCVCDGSFSYLTFDTKSAAREWLLKHNYIEYKDFPGVFFEDACSFAEYKIRKFLKLPYYGIVREHHNKREFL